MSRDESTDPTDLFVGMVKAGHATRDEKWSQNLRVDGRTVDFKLDTGSDVYIYNLGSEHRCVTCVKRFRPCRKTRSLAVITPHGLAGRRWRWPLCQDKLSTCPTLRGRSASPPVAGQLGRVENFPIF